MAHLAEVAHKALRIKFTKRKLEKLEKLSGNNSQAVQRLLKLKLAADAEVPVALVFAFFGVEVVTPFDTQGTHRGEPTNT